MHIPLCSVITVDDKHGQPLSFIFMSGCYIRIAALWSATTLVQQTTLFNWTCVVCERFSDIKSS